MRGRYWQRPAGTCLSVDDADVFDFVEQRDPTEGEWFPRSLEREHTGHDAWDPVCWCGEGGELVALARALVLAGCRCKWAPFRHDGRRAKCIDCGVEAVAAADAREAA